MKSTKDSHIDWNLTTFKGAEEYHKKLWKRRSWREKLHWLEESRIFMLKLSPSKKLHSHSR